MALQYQSFVDSKPFKFLVGETGKPFYIHASLAAQQSSTLGTLIKGGMVEAKKEYAVLEDVDEDTLIRFIQFAYTGDYAVAEPDVILSQPDVAVGSRTRVIERGTSPDYLPADHPTEMVPDEVLVEEAPDVVPAEEEDPPPPAAADFGWGNFESTPLRKKSRKKKVSAWSDDIFEEPLAAASADFRSKGERLWDAFKAKAHVKYADVWRPNVNSDHCEDYTPVFLCHAKLYVFSDKYLIEPLSKLVLQKLRLNLSRFELHSQRIGDVVELLKYAYEHTADYEEGIDPLRDLIADYLVCHIEKIVGFRNFEKLLQENGDVAKDLMPKLIQRLD